MKPHINPGSRYDTLPLVGIICGIGSCASSVEAARLHMRANNLGMQIICLPEHMADTTGKTKQERLIENMIPAASMLVEVFRAAADSSKMMNMNDFSEWEQVSKTQKPFYRDFLDRKKGRKKR